MRARIIGGFAKLVDHMLRRHAVRIAHAEIDNILAPRSRLGLHRVHFSEDIRRQAFDAVKFFGHYFDRFIAQVSWNRCFAQLLCDCRGILCLYADRRPSRATGIALDENQSKNPRPNHAASPRLSRRFFKTDLYRGIFKPIYSSPAKQFASGSPRVRSTSSGSYLEIATSTWPSRASG